MGINNKEFATQEWSYEFISEKVGNDPIEIELSAPDAVLPLLCNRLDLHSIESLEAKLILTRNAVNKVVNVHGIIDAVIYQKCVITGDPVIEYVEDSFDAWFAEPNNTVSFTKVKRERSLPVEGNEQPMLEEYEDPENIIDGVIDLGELVTQHLSLAINPYPRKKGAVLESDNATPGSVDDEDIYDNPFAALKAWKADEKKNNNK